MLLDFPPPDVEEVVPFDWKVSDLLEKVLNYLNPDRADGFIPVAFDTPLDPLVDTGADIPALPSIQDRLSARSRSLSAVSEQGPPLIEGQAPAPNTGKSFIMTYYFYFLSLLTLANLF